MRRLIGLFGILIAAATTAAQSQISTATTDVRHSTTAAGNLIDGQGRRVGEARLQQTPHGVILKVDLMNATPGVHGLHLHEVGRCDVPFESAGGHFNPTGRQHGFLNPRGPHLGDLPNIAVPTSTQLSLEYFIADVTLTSGPHPLLDADGSAIVMHSGADDYATDPAGGSGERLACGVISRSDADR